MSEIKEEDLSEKILQKAKEARDIYYELSGLESKIDTVLDAGYKGLKQLNTFSSEEKKKEFLDKIEELTILKGMMHGSYRAIIAKNKIFLQNKIYEMLRSN